MAFKPNCGVIYKEVEGNSLQTTKNYLIAYGIIDKYNNIIEGKLNDFRQAVTHLTNLANKKGRFPERLYSEQNGKKAIPNIPAFKKLDGINEYNKKKLEKLGQQTELKFQTSQEYQNSLNEGLEWAKQTFPNFTPEFQQGLIEGIARGSFNTLNDVITFSEEFADKGTVKHEFGHLAFKYLPKEQQEAILNEGSKLFNIPRGESKATVKYSKEQQNQIDFTLKSVDILQSPKAIQTFEKGKKANWSLEKTLTELQVPKEQKDLILNLGKPDREEIITDLLANYSYTVEINTANFGKSKKVIPTSQLPENHIIFFGDEQEYQNAGISYKTEETQDNTQYYSNLTVPGGTNYTENEIATPLITPSIKGHAQFATDKGIGWFRSDDKLNLKNAKKERILEFNDITGEVEESGDYLEGELEITKTRRILEVQSDLFQKGRDKEDLVEGEYHPDYSIGITKETVQKTLNQNQFLQLLNKNNNWVTFFVKSIIQDSAKKGYEKVLFPLGDTASKIEGHSTLEEFKRQKEDRIKALEDEKSKIREEQYFVDTLDDVIEFKSYEEAKNFSDQDFSRTLRKVKGRKVEIDNEIIQLKQELERVEKEGFAALRPIYKFYEETVNNILKKQGYNPVKVTDEYGNSWNEIEIKPEYLENIKLQSPNVEYSGDLAIEEKIMEMLEKSPDKIVPKSAIAKFFEQLKQWLKSIFNKKTQIQQFINDVNSGKYSYLKPSTSTFGTTKYQKVENQKEISTEVDKITKEISENVEKAEIVKTVDDFFDVTRSRLTKIIKNRNYDKLKQLFTTPEGINRYDSLQSLLKDAQKALDDIPGINRKVRAIALGIVQTQDLTNLIAEDVNNIISNKEKALENITTLQYYLYTLNDWKLFLQEARDTFQTNPNTTKTIDSIIGNIEAIEKKIIQNDISGLVEAFKPLLAPASEGYTNTLTESLNKYQNLANNTKDAARKKEYQKIAKSLQDKIKTYDFSVNENIAEFLKGNRGDTNMYSYLLEAFSDSPDPIVGSFSNWLKNQIQDINSEVNSIERSYEKELEPLYSQLGGRFNPETLGKQLTFEDERVDYDGNDFKVVQLLNPFQGYKKDEQIFQNSINSIQEAIKNGENIEENTEKLIAKKKEFAKWKQDYIHQEFTSEYYDKYELWEDEVGQRLKQKVEAIFDQIRQIQAPALLTGNELSQIELDEIDSLLKEYTLLGNVNQLDGNPKTGEELEEAKKMQQIRELNNKFFEWKDNTQAFERAKQRHSEYIISTGIAENSPEYEEEMQKWEDNNTRTVIKQEFYDERDEIFQEINDLLSVYKTDEDNSDFEEVWEDIKSLTYGHRDEDGQPIGTEIAKKGSERIKAATERLEEIKNSVQSASGLSKNEQARVSELYEKVNNGSINSAERQELTDLNAKKKANGLSETSKKRLGELFEKIKELQSRIPTEYYVDTFNNLSQKYSVTIDNSGFSDNQNILQSPKLQELLTHDDFREWFELNHIQVLRYNRETNSSEYQWERLYQWNRIVPNNPDYIEVKPAKKYSYRVVKDEFKTKQVVGETVDNKGNFLPKLDGKDDRYINKEYFRLKNSSNPKDKALFKMLNIHTEHLLSTQEDIPNKNKLYLDLPRLRKSKTERNTEILKQLQEKPSDIAPIIWNGIKSKLQAQTDYREDEGNYQSVFADKYGNEFTSVPIKYTGKLEAQDVSLDIFKAVMKYTYSAKVNQKLVELSPISNSLSRVLTEFTPKNTNKTIKGRITENPLGKSNVRLQAIQAITRRVFEGEEKKMELGKKVETIVGLVKGLTVIKTIAYDLPASVANIINAEVQNFINASNGYISRSNLGAAHNRFFTEYFTAFQKDYWENKIGQKSLQSQIFDLYGFVQSHSYEESVGEKISQSKVKDALSLKWMTNHREWGELFVQSVNALAYLDATKVQQGQQTISLLDAYELDSKGVIKLKDGIDEEWNPNGAKFKALKERIANHNSRVHGNYAKGIDKPEAETYTTFSVFIMMKRFFYSMFQNRFAASDVQLTKYGVRSTARFNVRTGKEHGYYLQTLNYAASQLESRLQTGEFQSATEDEKIAIVKTALDMGTIVIAYLILTYALGFDPDDDDKYKKLKKNSWLTNQLIYQTARLQTETSTFVNPYQYGNFIFDSPIVWTTLKSYLELIKYTIGNITNDDDSYYKKDYGLYKKGESKAKARLYKVTGIEKTLNLQEEDAALTNYLKMRAR